MHATCWVWLLRDSFQKSTLPSPHGARGLNSSWQSEQQVPLATDADHQPHLLSVHPTATGSSSLAHLHAVIPPSKSKELPSVPETRSQLISLTAQSLVVALIKLKMRLKKKNPPHCGQQRRQWDLASALSLGHLHSPLAHFTLTLTPHTRLPPCLSCSLC